MKTSFKKIIFGSAALLLVCGFSLFIFLQGKENSEAWANSKGLIPEWKSPGDKRTPSTLIRERPSSGESRVPSLKVPEKRIKCATPSREPFRIQGKVRDMDGRGLAATVAAFPACRSSQEKKSGSPIQRVKTEKDGSFSLVFRKNRETFPKAVDLLALAPGFKPEWKKEISLASSAKRVDFVLSKGLSVSGRIRDSSGKPLAGIPVLACPASFTSGVVHTFVSSNILEKDFRSMPHLWRKGYHQSSSVTDDAGRFLIEGLKKGKYVLLLKSYHWILSPTVRFEAGSRGVEGIAKKALFLEARVLDARTQKPVFQFPFDIMISDHKKGESMEIGGSGINGALKVAWLPQWTLSSIPLPVKVTIYPTAYRKYSGTLYLREFSSAPPPTIRLEPIQLETVLFRATYKDGTPLKRPILVVSYHGSGAGSPSGRETAHLQENGIYQVRLPKGRLAVRILRPMMKIQWPGESMPRYEWSIPGKGLLKVVFSKGGTARIHLSPETMDSFKKGKVVLQVLGSRKKNGGGQFGCKILFKEFKGDTCTLREIPPGIHLWFGLSKSIWDDEPFRETKHILIHEGDELDFYL